MEVLGVRSKAGIWCEDTRRSLRAVRGALDVAIIDKDFINAKAERIQVSKWRGCRSLGRASRRRLSGAMNYVISKMKILKGITRYPNPKNAFCTLEKVS